MPHARVYELSIVGRWSLLLGLCLACCLPPLAAAQSADEAALRTLTEKFFAAYQAKDLDGLMRMWSAKSADLAAGKQSFEQTFAAVDKAELKSLSIRKLTVDGDQATVRVVVEINAVEAKTGKPAAGFGKLNRTLQYSKEGGEWKVWRYVSSEEELAAALVAAKTDAEQQALLAAEKELITAELQKALMAKGNSFFDRGSYAQAMSIFQVTLKIAEQLGDKKGIATLLRSIGSIYYYQGRYAPALELYQNSLKLAEEIGDKQNICYTLNNIGIVHRLQGNYALALEYHQKGLKIAEEIGDKPGICRVLASIGLVHLAQSNYAPALEYQQKSLKIAEEIGDKQNISVRMTTIGNIYLSQSDYVRALEYQQKSLKIAEEIGAKQWVFPALNNLGLVYMSQGNYALALEYYQKSLKIAEEIGAKQPLSLVLINIGIVHRLQGDFAQAIEYQQKGLKIAEEIGDKRTITVALTNMGAVGRSEGNNAQALEYYQKSLKLKEEIGDKEGIAITLNNMGIVHRLQGNNAQALEYYQKSLKLREEIGDKQGIANTLNNIAIVHRVEGRYVQAVEVAQRAAAIANQIGSSEDFWQPRATAGTAYRALHRPDQARQAFADSIAAIEKLRGQVAGGEQQQQHFFENHVSPYYEMVDLLIDQNNPAEALTYAERAKGRVLLDVLSSGKVNITKAMTQQEQVQERTLNGEIVSLNSQVYREKVRQQPDEARLQDLNTRLQKARLNYEAFQTNLYAAHPELQSLRGETPPLTLMDSATLIPDANTALLEFVVMEDKTYLFVLTKNQSAAQAAPDLQVYTLNVKQKDLADRTRRFRQRLASLDVSFADLAGSLYDSLLKPAQAQLQMKTALVIVPDGVLWELPFQALMSARHRYVIEDGAIAYAPSLTVLREMIKLRRNHLPAATAQPTLLAFGNSLIGQQTQERVRAVLMDEKLLPLPEAEHQVKLLAQLYGAGQSQIYVGAEAREDRAKAEAGKYRILHLATHGILNDASPMYSQVVLSQSAADQNNDGLLEAWEIMKLDLKADLVILSACETARGRVGAGEGVIGLSWALFVAGCPTTVVSQWKVESVSTTELMTEFHRHLKAILDNPAAKQSKAEALRQAALKLLRRKKYSHPFYWAAFVVIGDGR
jgi:CHAT domain-containing protein/Tfp pilus assembly protein PilF/ketosteroid isomerase-like protein